jgi:hypothetical protein
MEVEVSALMSVADEALWNSAGLFTSTNELSRRTNRSLSTFETIVLALYLW